MLFFQKYFLRNSIFVTNRLAAHLTDHSNDSMKLFPVWPQTPAEPVQTWKPKHSTDSVYLMDFSFTDLRVLRAFGASNLFIFQLLNSPDDNLVTILHHNIHFVSPLIFKSLDISRRMINIGIGLVTLSFASPAWISLYCHPPLRAGPVREILSGLYTCTHRWEGGRLSVTDKAPARSQHVTTDPSIYRLLSQKWLKRIL